MQPYDAAAVKVRFLAQIEQVKKQTGESEATISRAISGSKDRINNIKRGDSSIDLELLHNLEQLYGVEQYEIIKGVAVQSLQKELEHLTTTAIAQLQQIQSSLQQTNKSIQP